MLGIDLSNVQAQGDYSPLPAGDYPFVVEDAEMKDTKAGNGQYIKVKLKVTGDNYANRVIFHNFNVKNQNPKATEIGLGQLKRLMQVAGKKTESINSLNELIGLSAVMRLKVEADNGYGESNKVTSFKELPTAQKGSAIPTDVPF